MEDYDEISSDNSYNEACYSDQLSSDIEAELYGLVHHDAQNNSISLQDKSDSLKSNSFSLQGKSDSLENNSISLQDKSNSAESNSILLQNSLSDDFSILVLPTNVIAEDTETLSEKLKNTVKKSSQNYNYPVKNNHTDFFCSDAVVNTNLYTNFESPVQKQKIQNSRVQSKNSRNVTEVPGKRKSDVVSEILGNIQLKKNRNSKSMQTENSISKQNKNSHGHNSIISKADSYVEVIEDSSDSDSDSSIIFFEPDQSNLQTNMANETVVLSSDSEDSDSSMEKNVSQACQKKKVATLNADLTPKNKDPWHINFEDKFRTKKHSNRYHENALLTCSNCHLKGHNAKSCSVPKTLKCFFCGDYHSGMNCRNKICSKCFHQGHDCRRCYIRYIGTCELCQMRGHSERNCPDIWRRYHLTTSKGGIVKGNPNSHSPLYCYNCGLKGHYGAECRETRIDRGSFRTWTTVISYKNPIYVQQREGESNFHEKSKYNRTPLSRRRKGNLKFSKDTPTQNTKRKKKKKSPKTPSNENQQSATRPKNTVPKEVYFPRTPKIPNSMTPTSSTVRLKKKKFKMSSKDRLTQQQLMHRIGLHERLGLPFPSTV